MPSRRYVPLHEHLAIEYAKNDLGYSSPEVYGNQLDPQVREISAVWLRDQDNPDYDIGLIVHTKDGVLEEFDPAIDGKPGELQSGSNCDLSRMRMEVY